MKRSRIFGLFIFALFLVGCASSPWYPGHNWNPWKQTDLDKDFGNSFNQAVTLQTANPVAGDALLKPVEGEDGVTAEKVLERYRKSYERKEAAPTFILNVTPGSSGGGK